jgi:Ca2+-binding RTX toxin-like protein
VKASVSYTLSANVENLTLTGLGDINGTGNELANNLIGNSGINRLDGGAGSDTLIGGAGDDIYVIDDTSDVVTESENAGTDTIEASVSYTLAINVENLTLTGESNVNGIGNTGNNTITGNIGINLLDGGTGADTMIGGAGDDTYVIDNTGDVVTEIDGGGTDTVEASVTYTLAANVEKLTLTGSVEINGTGNADNNTLIGNIGINRLDGGAGADTMEGGRGNDTYVIDNIGDVVTEAAGQGTDTVEASIDHTLSTDVENLTLTGGADLNGKGNKLANTLTGNSGNNTFDGQAGADTMIGGDGNDIYVVDDAGDKVTEVANQGTDTVQSSIAYTLGDHLENLTLTGAAAINGTGTTTNNTLTGNSGNNTLDGKAGADTMIGGDGNDIYVVDNTGDKVTELVNQGSDTVQSSITYTLGDHLETLTLTGTAVNGTGNDLVNTINGNSTNNRLDGGEGADNMVGGAGDDTYVVDNTLDVVTEAASAGNDTIEASVTYTLSANVEKLILKEGSGNINGAGNGLANTLTGNSGNNRFDGGVGNDTMIGGAGDDTYVVDIASDVITENAGEGTDTVESSASYTLTTNLENLTLTGSGDIKGTGNTGNNSILGNSGNNVLVGSAGDDTLNGSEGTDTASYSTSANITATLGLNGATGSATGEGTDVLINIENLQGGSGNDTLNGNEQANKFEGGAGNDTLNGGAGNDTLIGGAGEDSMTGGLGDDIYVVDNISDVVTEAVSEGTETVESSITYVLGDHLENLTLTGSGIINGTGNNADNILTGNSGANLLSGGAGKDALNGGAGEDTLDGGSGIDNMFGGGGDDTYLVDSTSDVVTEKGGEGTDTVEASVTYTLSGYVEKLTLTGSSDINGTGNGLDNTLTGNTGKNILDGGDGNDTLNGGAGYDSLTGGAGNDSLTGNAGNDTLIGGAGDDTLDLRTDNITLVGDRAEGGDGDDTIIIDQLHLAGDVVNLDGGLGTDTLKVYGSANGQLDLKALNAFNFEKLDLRTDGVGTTVLLSSAGIMKMVNKSNDVDVLTLQLGSGDFYEITEEVGVVAKTGQNLINFYSNSVSPQNLIAQVNFDNA